MVSTDSTPRFSGRGSYIHRMKRILLPFLRLLFPFYSCVNRRRFSPIHGWRAATWYSFNEIIPPPSRSSLLFYFSSLSFLHPHKRLIPSLLIHVSQYLRDLSTMSVRKWLNVYYFFCSFFFFVLCLRQFFRLLRFPSVPLITWVTCRDDESPP